MTNTNTTMAGLTEEQKERIRKNRERALEIRRRKLKEKEEAATKRDIVGDVPTNPCTTNPNDNTSCTQESTNKLINAEHIEDPNSSLKKNVTNNETALTSTRNRNTNNRNVVNSSEGAEIDGGNDIELEDFEVGASQYVTKQQAMKMYCLPAGTLAVCAFIEKDNPKQSKWSKMKLYHRSEIRRRARERFGGLDGLIEERNKRELKRVERDYQSAYDVFESRKKPKKK